VGNDPASLAAARASLVAAGWTVEEAGSVSAAVRRLDTDRIHAAVLDLGLMEPGPSESIRALRAASPGLPVVVLASPEQEGRALQALRAGAQDHVVKGELQRAVLPLALSHAVERKRSEDALHRLEGAVATMQLGVTVTDLNGRIVYLNQAEAEMHGYTVAEMLGRDARALSPRDDWQPLDRERLQRVKRWKRERVRIRRDGSTFPVNLLSDLVSDPLGQPIGIVTTCEDITERKRSEEALRRSEERYALAARGTNDGLWDWDLREGRVHYSERWKAMLGYDPGGIGEGPHEWLGRVHPDDLDELQERLTAHREGRCDLLEYEHRVRHRDGRYRWVFCRGFAVRGTGGEAVRLVGAQTDVTDHRPLDPLTGLANRILFTDKLREAIARDTQGRGLFAVLFVDLDHFKGVNDRLGHHAGDRVLVAVARRLEGCVRPGDTAARLAGDEFAVLLQRLDHPDEATMVAERIQRALGQPVEEAGGEVPSASIGVTLSTTGYQRPEELLQEADAAMYRAKAEGRSRCEIFDAGMRRRLAARQRVQEELRQAVTKGEFTVHYQPVVELATGQVRGLEGLLRWRGLLLPMDVLALAEETGGIVRIGSWLMREVCRQFSEWRARHPAAQDLYVSVNATAGQFLRSDLVPELRGLFDEFGLPPRALALEVTEDAFLKDGAMASAQARALAELGVRLQLDRFGTGTAALNLLRRFPLAGVKLDASMAAGIDTGTPEARLFPAVIGMVRALGLPVTATGIDGERHVEVARAAGCEEAQGSWFGDSMPSAAVIARILAPLAAPPLLSSPAGSSPAEHGIRP
jgi:diguanylate cyclase (GGDEF)-like protein/PAS domain S-box-containing protein